MSQTTNTALDQYSFLRDFLTSIGSGSFDPVSARQRIETLAQGVGVSPATIDACYTAGGAPADIENCVQTAVNAVVFQTNFSAPTAGQFLGGVAGAALSASYAPYIDSLLTVWRLFVHTGHVEYEYLPTTVSLADPSAARPDELLMGVKVPTIRPPGAASDVLFFTIGDPHASEHAPVVLNAAPANGVCERTDRIPIPLHFDHTSRYVHDAELTVRPDGRAPYVVTLDPRSLDAPILERSQLQNSVDGAYAVSLNGRFGFAAVEQPPGTAAHIEIPGNAPWNVAAAAHHPPVAGETLDVIASSATASCLSRAEFQTGSNAPLALSMTQLDAQHVELRASLAGVAAGGGVIRLYEADPAGGTAFESSTTVAIESPPPAVDRAAATASIGDAYLTLHGTNLDRVSGVLIGNVAYTKTPGAGATAACFDGPSLGGAAPAVGQTLPAQLLLRDERPGEPFPLVLAERRPALAAVSLPSAPPGPHLSTTAIEVQLETGGPHVPRQFAVRVRKMDGTAATPCDASALDPTAVTVAASDVHLRSADALRVGLHPGILGDRAFGTLQMQIVDTATNVAGDWQNLPGSFVRAPSIAQIACPADPPAACRLYGSGLAAIDAVADSSGAFVAPNVDCPATPKGVACIEVPRVAHYVLRLADGNVIDSVPDRLIAVGSPGPA